MRFPLPSCVLFGFALAACTGGDDDGSGNLTLSGKVEILSIDRQAHTLTTVTTVTECEENGTSSTVSDTSVDHYAIKDGKLILWDEEDCTATTLAGTSADIVGTWKGNGIEMESAIPAEYRPDICPATLPVDSSDLDMFSDAAVTYKISEHRIEFTGTGTFCMGEQMAAEMLDNGFTLESKSCNDVVLKDPAGKPMVVKTSLAKNRMSVSMTYKGKTCGFANEIPLPGHPVDCAKQVAAMESYMQCVQGMAGAKVSAALGKVSAKLF
jgi:hypothetical protein